MFMAPCINNSTDFNKLNPRPNDKSLVIYNLDSYSETELKELKHKFISQLDRVQSFLTQLQSRELELLQLQDKQGNAVDKTSNKITGQKRAMPFVSPHTQTKRKRLVRKATVELNSSETRKVEAAMMSKCGVILDTLMNHKHGWVFSEPVDAVALGLRDYHQVVERPMDLGTVKSKLCQRVYTNPLDFATDVSLTFGNAMLYNRKGHEVHTMAAVLLEMFDKLFDPAYEKFRVERQRLIVQQRKRSKPLAESTQTPVGFALAKKVCKEVAAEARANPRKRGEMCVEERDELGLVLQDLAEEHLDEILQIMAKRNPQLTTPDGDGEIELDVSALDSESMWDLHELVNNLKSKQDNKVT